MLGPALPVTLTSVRMVRRERAVFPRTVPSREVGRSFILKRSAVGRGAAGAAAGAAASGIFGVLTVHMDTLLLFFVMFPEKVQDHLLALGSVPVSDIT